MELIVSVHQPSLLNTMNLKGRQMFQGLDLPSRPQFVGWGSLLLPLQSVFHLKFFAPSTTIFPTPNAQSHDRLLHRALAIYFIQIFKNWNTISTQYCIRFRHTACWFGDSVHYSMSSVTSVVTMSAHNTITKYGQCSLCCTLPPCYLFIYNWKSVPLNPPHLFWLSPHPLPLW